MPTFPKLGKPDKNILEEVVFGKATSDKRAERLARSQKARKRRSEIKELDQRRDIKGNK